MIETKKSTPAVATYADVSFQVQYNFIQLGANQNLEGKRSQPENDAMLSASAWHCTVRIHK
jgi:hypothetical protein